MHCLFFEDKREHLTTRSSVKAYWGQFKIIAFLVKKSVEDKKKKCMKNLATGSILGMIWSSTITE